MRVATVVDYNVVVTQIYRRQVPICRNVHPAWMSPERGLSSAIPPMTWP
jgi:hypothetical protein